ncbi:MAG: ATP synthase F1 subunit delta [Bacteroidetes bacterium]|jgi:F-type H+-transporting ATPase subunit delta|nr:ATP synthase F1 subunit delta [Bacteroidota bacterium]
MLQDRIAHRYAKSLFELALEKDILEQVKDDLQALDDLFHKSYDLRVLLRSPVITSRKKWAVLNQLLKAKLSDTVFQFLHILTLKGREALLDFVWNEFEKLYNAHKNITVVQVQTAVPLEVVDRQQLIRTLEAQLDTQVDLKEAVDPELIAGLELRIGHKLYDGTIANALRKIKQELVLN